MKGLAGLTLMNHPDNPNHPTAFHVRDEGTTIGALVLGAAAHAQSLPDTRPPAPNSEFSAAMVDGIDKLALRLVEQSKEFKSVPTDIKIELVATTLQP